VTTDLLRGEIIEQLRGLVEAKEEYERPPGETGNSQQACTLPNQCSEGCHESDGCTTDERKQKQHTHQAGWFAPPAARG